MQSDYSQIRAMLAITRYSLTATFRSPSAVIFSIMFPLIFILVFGWIGSGGGISLDLAFEQQSDTNNLIFKAIQHTPGLHVVDVSETDLTEALSKGDITALLNISKLDSSQYRIQLTSSEAVNPDNLAVLQSVLNDIISRINKKIFPNAASIAIIEKDIKKIPGREYRRIDFILPGQLGFSLLSAGIFGVAFLFFNLRQQLVLKRFFATPIKRTYIVLGEALSRVIFQMSTAIIIIGVGTLAFKYTLVNGFSTLLEILLLSFLALIVFMGFGFVVSGLAKNESSIPPFANLFTLPQFLLAGTFFPVNVFPQWLQYICNVLPLTHFNNAMRSIAFEGAPLWSCWNNLLVLTIWGILAYATAVKVFKWE
jgi:ABC-2 type transport system permease protein